MKVTFEIDDFRRASVSAHPGEYDAYPAISSILFDAIPTRINKYRESIACALPFLPLINGEIVTESPVFPLSATKTRELAPFEAIFTNIDWKPADIPGGSGLLTIIDDQSRLPSHEDHVGETTSNGASKSAVLRILRSDIFNGAINSFSHCTMASNLWLLRELETVDRYLLGLIAVGVLFAEDFDARILRLNTQHKFENIELEKLTTLLESVGLKLEIGNVVEE